MIRAHAVFVLVVALLLLLEGIIAEEDDHVYTAVGELLSKHEQNKEQKERAKHMQLPLFLDETVTVSLSIDDLDFFQRKGDLDDTYDRTRSLYSMLNTVLDQWLDDFYGYEPDASTGSLNSPGTVVPRNFSTSVTQVFIENGPLPSPGQVVQPPPLLLVYRQRFQYTMRQSNGVQPPYHDRDWASLTPSQLAILPFDNSNNLDDLRHRLRVAASHPQELLPTVAVRRLHRAVVGGHSISFVRDLDVGPFCDPYLLRKVSIYVMVAAFVVVFLPHLVKWYWMRRNQVYDDVIPPDLIRSLGLNNDDDDDEDDKTVLPPTPAELLKRRTRLQKENSRRNKSLERI